MTYDDAHLSRAIAALDAGEAVIFPTETVYGIAVAVGPAQSPEILYDIKGRDREKPIAWLVSNALALDVYGVMIPEFAHILVRAFWPGPLTLIVKAADTVPAAFCSTNATIGLRMPANELALKLIARIGVPLATTSANFAGAVAPQTLDEVDPALRARVGAVFGGDIDSSGVASTIIDCTQGYPVLIRQGEISMEEIVSLL